jgi:hypothetical protein
MSGCPIETEHGGRDWIQILGREHQHPSARGLVDVKVWGPAPAAAPILALQEITIAFFGRGNESLRSGERQWAQYCASILRKSSIRIDRGSMNPLKRKKIALFSYSENCGRREFRT